MALKNHKKTITRIFILLVVMTLICMGAPVMLLDDVLSELDRDRQRFILRNIDDMQVFITCCDSRVLDGTEGKIFSVSGGRITEG